MKKLTALVVAAVAAAGIGLSGCVINGHLICPPGQVGGGHDTGVNAQCRVPVRP